MEKAQRHCLQKRRRGNTLASPFLLPSDLLQGLPVGEPGWKRAGYKSLKNKACRTLSHDIWGSPGDGAKDHLKTIK